MVREYRGMKMGDDVGSITPETDQHINRREGVPIVLLGEAV